MLKFFGHQKLTRRKIIITDEQNKKKNVNLRSKGILFKQKKKTFGTTLCICLLVFKIYNDLLTVSVIAVNNVF